jgi:hypothetical protein
MALLGIESTLARVRGDTDTLSLRASAAKRWASSSTTGEGDNAFGAGASLDVFKDLSGESVRARTLDAGTPRDVTGGLD